MNNHELMCDAVKRICHKAGFIDAVSFNYDINFSIEITILGEAHTSYNTVEEAFAFLDGMESAIEKLAKILKCVE